MRPFIVLEGIEGSGKSTQAAMLAAWMGARGIAHVHTREPGGTPEGEEIRRILLHSTEIPARAELMLMLAARAILVERVVRPALAEGRVVLADRFHLSSLAYQGYGRGLSLEEVRASNLAATGGLLPDLTIYLEVEPGEGEARRAAAGKRADRIEAAGAAFHAAVDRGYRELAGSEPGLVRVDGAGDAAEVHGRIVAALAARFPGTFDAAGG